MSSSFEHKLELGHEGEKLIGDWLRLTRGCGVINCYGLVSEDRDDKAPKLHFATDGLVLPDLDLCKGGRRCWLEVKTLGYSPENRRLGMRVHGIKYRHYRHYLAVEEQTGSHAYLCVLEMASGDILIARLRGLVPYPCQCCGCANDQTCQATPRDLVYFNRASFRTEGNLCGQERFDQLRARWDCGGRPLTTESTF